MAREYKPNFMDDEQDNSGVPTSPGTQGAIPTGSSFAAPKQRKASSGFTNLKKYFNANQGNKLIDNVAKPAETQLQGAQQNLAQSTQDFNRDIQNEQAKLAAARTQGQQALGYVDTGVNTLNPQSLPADATEEQKAKAAIDANAAAAQALTKVRDYRYSGPTEIANQSKLMDDKFQLQDFAQATKNEAGRGAILQTLFGKGGNYTGGARNLDNFLLSSDQQNLNKLKDIRSQTQKYEQDLRNLDTQTGSKVGTLMGKIDTTKNDQKTAMEKMRDAIKLRLEEQTGAYNAAQHANTTEVTDEELLKYIPEYSGYTLEDKPNEFKASYNPLQMLYASPNAPQHYKDSVARAPEPIVTGTQEPNWVNLFKNTGLEPHQIADPNKTFESGKPNQSEAFVTAKSLKPLFSESYTDNTWDSLDPEAIERRNILSRVLADDVENGLITPKQKNEIEVKLDNELLEQLKSIPQLGESAYINSYYNPRSGLQFGGSLSSSPQVHQDIAKADGFRDYYSKQQALANVNQNSIPQVNESNATVARELAIARKLKELGLMETMKTGLLNPNLTFKGGINYVK